MRKDKGLNGDTDRIPMLTWIMFLKFLDDMDRINEEEAIISGGKFVPTIDPPYRWRDWAAPDQGPTGEELIAFVNQEEATRIDGARGPGLFAYLRRLEGIQGVDRRDVVSAVFRGVTNRMINGYLLRDVLSKISQIHFTSSDEMHTLGLLYESMLREMRDAAGDSGEFYTPRPVVRFMVEATAPVLGETVMDPACGTGGFLGEAFTYLERQCSTVDDRRVLQEASIFGAEAKPLPYLLAQMNLVLHGLDSPQIDPLNSLRFPLREIGDRDRVDVVLTNPPFGGEEEKGMLSNFPEDKQTSETALLFLQLIMRRLRREPKPGRAAVVVPNGTLSGDGISARIKEELLKEFNLHTIVRLPDGVFAPYTDIPTNLLFFDRSKPTKEIWYYEHPLPAGRRKYTKTQPLQFEEFAECSKWLSNRSENERAWRVSIDDVLKYDGSTLVEANLDIKNPRDTHSSSRASTSELLVSLGNKEEDVARAVSAAAGLMRSVEVPIQASPVVLSDVLKLEIDAVPVEPTASYPIAGVYSFGRGFLTRAPLLGASTTYKYLHRLRTDDFVLSQLKAWEGALARVPPELDGWFLSPQFPTFRADADRLDIAYLEWYCKHPKVWERLRRQARGMGARRDMVSPNRFLTLVIPLPSLSDQKEIVAAIASVNQIRRLQQDSAEQAEVLLLGVLDDFFKEL